MHLNTMLCQTIKNLKSYSKDQKLAILKNPELLSLVPSSVPLSWQWQEWLKHLQSHTALENQLKTTNQHKVPSNCPYRYKSPRTRKAKTFSRKQLLKFLAFYPSSLYLPRIFKLLFYLRSIWNKHRQLNVYCRTVLKNWFLCFQIDMCSKVCFKNLPEFSSYKTLNPRTSVAQDVMLSVLPFWVAGFFTWLFFSGGRKGWRIRERRQYKQKKHLRLPLWLLRNHTLISEKRKLLMISLIIWKAVVWTGNINECRGFSELW